MKHRFFSPAAIFACCLGLLLTGCKPDSGGSKDSGGQSQSNAISSLSVVPNSTKTLFYQDEPWICSVALNVVYTDNSTERVTSGYTLTIPQGLLDGGDPQKIADDLNIYTIGVTYRGKDTGYTVYVGGIDWDGTPLTTLDLIPREDQYTTGSYDLGKDFLLVGADAGSKSYFVRDPRDYTIEKVDTKPWMLTGGTAATFVSGDIEAAAGSYTVTVGETVWEGGSAWTQAITIFDAILLKDKRTGIFLGAAPLLLGEKIVGGTFAGIGGTEQTVWIEKGSAITKGDPVPFTGARGKTYVRSDTAKAISNAPQLTAMSANADGNYILANDIDLSQTNGSWTGGSEWEPVGDGADHRFRGWFYGDGHTISGLKLKSSIPYSGLFGILEKARVEYLKIVLAAPGTPLLGYTNVGVVAGAINGNASVDTLISKVDAGGTLSLGESAALANVGGFVGQTQEKFSISESHSGVSITANLDSATATYGFYAGGIIGQVLKGTNSQVNIVENCYTDGNITVTMANSSRGDIIGGGIAAFLKLVSGTNHTVLHSYATGTISFTGGKGVGNLGIGYLGVGGLVGVLSYTGRILNSAALNTALTMAGTNTVNIGRVESVYVSSGSSGRYAGNIANKDMTLLVGSTSVPVSDKGADKPNGADVDMETLSQADFDTGGLGWDFSATGPWKWDENAKRPKLKWLSQ